MKKNLYLPFSEPICIPGNWSNPTRSFGPTSNRTRPLLQTKVHLCDPQTISVQSINLHLQVPLRPSALPVLPIQFDTPSMHQNNNINLIRKLHSVHNFDELRFLEYRSTVPRCRIHFRWDLWNRIRDQDCGSRRISGQSHLFPRSLELVGLYSYFDNFCGVHRSRKRGWKHEADEFEDFSSFASFKKSQYRSRLENHRFSTSSMSKTGFRGCFHHGVPDPYHRNFGNAKLQRNFENTMRIRHLDTRILLSRPPHEQHRVEHDETSL